MGFQLCDSTSFIVLNKEAGVSGCGCRNSLYSWPVWMRIGTTLLKATSCFMRKVGFEILTLTGHTEGERKASWKPSFPQWHSSSLVFGDLKAEKVPLLEQKIQNLVLFLYLGDFRTKPIFFKIMLVHLVTRVQTKIVRQLAVGEVIKRFLYTDILIYNYGSNDSNSQSVSCSST